MTARPIPLPAEASVPLDIILRAHFEFIVSGAVSYMHPSENTLVYGKSRICLWEMPCLFTQTLIYQLNHSCQRFLFILSFADEFQFIAAFDAGAQDT